MNMNNNNNNEIGNEQIGLVEDTDANCVRDQRSLCSAVSENYQQSRKKRRIADQPKSVMWMYSEDNKMRSKIEEELNMINNLSYANENSPVNCPAFVEPDTHLESGELPFNKFSGGFIINNNAKSDSSNEEADLKDRKRDLLTGPVNIAAGVHANRQPSTCQVLAKDNISADDPGNLLGIAESQLGLPWVDYLIKGDVMSFFPLDNKADEEFFKIAIAEPLSLTLPILDPPKPKKYAEDYSFRLVEDLHHWESLCSGGSSSHTGAFDVVNAEINSIEQKIRVSQQHHGSVPDNDVDCSREMEKCDKAVFHNTTNKSYKCGRTVSVAKKDASRSSYFRASSENCVPPVQQHVSTNLCVQGKDTFISLRSSISENCRFPASKEIAEKKTAEAVNVCSVNQCQSQRSYWFSVVFSKIKSDDKISRIVNATYLIFQSSSLFKNADGLANILHAVQMNMGLQDEEKTCAFVSVMISHLALRLHENAGSYVENLNLEPLTKEIKNLVSDGKRTLASDKPWAENVIELIMDFLVHREILMFEFNQQPADEYHLTHEDFIVSYKTATFNQLFVGSMILASICDVLDCAAFLWEISYDILLSHTMGISDILAIVHVFASICGKEFFSIAENDILAISICSLILHLESALESDGDALSSCQSSSRVHYNHPCQKCPFNQRCIDIDKIIHILLVKLEDIVASQSSSRCRLESLDSGLSTSGSTQRFKSKFNYPVSYKEQPDAFNWFTDEAFVCFTDTLSLLELLASYMNWHWICDKMFPHLLKIFESCTTVEYSAALLILLGKLSRLGIGFDGLEKDGISAVRKAFMSMIMRPHSELNRSLQIQLSAVNALVDLLPLQFEEIIGGCLSDNTHESFYHCMKGVQAWFSQLTDNQKASARIFFSCADALM